MTETRYASLSSGLLARKGAAKPAMRPQAFGHVGPAGIEDLGWNDMGFAALPEAAPEELPEHVPSSIAALTPSPKHASARPVDSESAAAEESEQTGCGESEAEGAEPPIAEPPVAAQRRAIAESLGVEQAPPSAADPPRRRRAKADVVTLPRRAAVPAPGRKAAFTLRLDCDRHLRLRLACAVTGRSAQQLVTAALDEALAAIPEIEALAERLPAQAGAGAAQRN